MKNGLNKNTQFPGMGYNSNHNRTGTTHTRMGQKSGRHPYLRPEFWHNPSNHFWENGSYSEASKEYFRDFVNRQV